MAERTRLLTRLTGRAIVGHPVAWQGTTAIGEQAFRARVTAWMTAFRQSAPGAATLFHSDGVEFAAALLGAWHADRTVYLPGDNLPTTCHQLDARVTIFAGEWASDRSPLAASGGSADSAFRPLAADFTGVIVFTSGSTGEPQAIAKRLAQLAAEVDTLERTFAADMGDADVVVATVSHQHIYGLLYKILWPLAAGRSFLAHSVAVPEALAAALAGRRAALIASPALLKRLPETLDWSAARHGLRAVFSSGGPLSPDAARLSERLLGRTPIEVLGSSETGGIASRRQSPATDVPWTPLPGVRVRPEAGRLCVQSPHLGDDQWFTTADLVEFVAPDAFSLGHRADRIAKIEGERMSLVAIERALIASPWVSDARVFPLAAFREQLAAVVTVTATGHHALEEDGKAAVTRALRALLAKSIERVALPRRWRFVHELPVDSQGKTSHAVLAALFDTRATAMPEARVISKSTARLMLDLRIPRDLVYFDGHFDDTPVLPGVVQIQWAIVYGREHLGVTGAFVRLEAIKFHRLIRPGSAVRLQLEWRVANSSLVFVVDSAGGTHASGRVVFAR